MLRRGYLNFFNGDCCFLGDGSDGCCVQLKQTTKVLLEDRRTPAHLVYAESAWHLDCGERSVLHPQGVTVWLDC